MEKRGPVYLLKVMIFYDLAIAKNHCAIGGCQLSNFGDSDSPWGLLISQGIENGGTSGN